MPAENLDEYRASLGQQTEGAVPLELFPSHTVRWVKRLTIFSRGALWCNSFHILGTVREGNFYFRRSERWMIFFRPAAMTLKSCSEYNFCFDWQVFPTFLQGCFIGVWSTQKGDWILPHPKLPLNTMQFNLCTTTNSVSSMRIWHWYSFQNVYWKEWIMLSFSVSFKNSLQLQAKIFKVTNNFCFVEINLQKQ